MHLVQSVNVTTPFIVAERLQRQEEEIKSLFPDQAQNQEIFRKNPFVSDDLSFYFLRERYLEAYNKIEFWKKLPGGEEYLAGVEPGVSKEALAQQLADWMRKNPQVCSLPSLILNKVAMTRLPSEIKECTNLEFLGIINIPLREISPEIGKLSSLKVLILTKTQVETLCQGISELKNIEKINISRNRLKNIDPLASLSTLKHLSACGNCIERLPSRLNWSQIEIVDLTNNRIGELPEAFYDLKTVTMACLSKNNLSVISESIRKMTQLKVIKLDHNQLSGLPSGLGELEQLFSISVTHNRLKQIPKSMGKSASLKEIVLLNNPMTSRPGCLSPHVWTGVQALAASVPET